MNVLVKYLKISLIALTLVSVSATAYQTFYVDTYPIEYFDEE